MMKHDVVEGKDGVCPKCKGRGFVTTDVPYGHPDFAKLINCECNGGRKPDPSPFDDLKVPDDVRAATFATVVPLPQIVPVIAVARTLVTPPHGVLTLAGQPGVGKSEAAGCIINAAKSAGIPALYGGSNDLFTRLNRMTKPGSPFDFDVARQKLLNVPVLCIDDLHALNRWPWALELLYDIICSRYDDRRKRLTCLITNESLDGWPDYVQSRIRDVECYLFELTGQDVRQRQR